MTEVLSDAQRRALSALLDDDLHSERRRDVSLAIVLLSGGDQGATMAVNAVVRAVAAGAAPECRSWRDAFSLPRRTLLDLPSIGATGVDHLRMVVLAASEPIETEARP